MNDTAAVQFLPGKYARFRVQTWIDWMVSAFKTVETWKLRHKTRRQLSVADARILKDVGISEAQTFHRSQQTFLGEITMENALANELVLEAIENLTFCQQRNAKSYLSGQSNTYASRCPRTLSTNSMPGPDMRWQRMDSVTTEN